MSDEIDLAAQLAQQKALVEALEASLEAEREAGQRLREEYATGLREAAERQREACRNALKFYMCTCSIKLLEVPLVTDI